MKGGEGVAEAYFSLWFFLSAPCAISDEPVQRRGAPVSRIVHPSVPLFPTRITPSWYGQEQFHRPSVGETPKAMRKLRHGQQPCNRVDRPFLCMLILGSNKDYVN